MAPSTSRLTAVLLLTGSVCLLVLIFIVSLVVEIGEFKRQFHADAREYEVISNGAWRDIAESMSLSAVRTKRSPYDYAGSIYEKKRTCNCAQGPNNCPRGPPGPMGKPGHRGHSGRSGKHGVPGVPAFSPSHDQSFDFYYKKPCTRVACAPGEPGPQGPPGASGDVGHDGVPGLHGLPGRDGLTGQDGPAGEAGPPGAPGIGGRAGAPGHKGHRYVSLPGEPGRQGGRGGAGKPGRRGAIGERGQPGPAGVAGTAGRWGAYGEPGVQGPVGDAGAPGEDGGYCKCPTRTHELEEEHREGGAAGTTEHPSGAAATELPPSGGYENPEVPLETPDLPDEEEPSTEQPPLASEYEAPAAPTTTAAYEIASSTTVETPTTQPPASSGAKGGYDAPKSEEEPSTSGAAEEPSTTTEHAPPTGYDDATTSTASVSTETPSNEAPPAAASESAATTPELPAIQADGGYAAPAAPAPLSPVSATESQSPAGGEYSVHPQTSHQPAASNAGYEKELETVSEPSEEPAGGNTSDPAGGYDQPPIVVTPEKMPATGYEAARPAPAAATGYDGEPLQRGHGLSGAAPSKATAAPIAVYSTTAPPASTPPTAKAEHDSDGGYGRDDAPPTLPATPSAEAAAPIKSVPLAGGYRAAAAPASRTSSLTKPAAAATVVRRPAVLQTPPSSGYESIPSGAAYNYASKQQPLLAAARPIPLSHKNDIYKISPRSRLVFQAPEPVPLPLVRAPYVHAN